MARLAVRDQSREARHFSGLVLLEHGVALGQPALHFGALLRDGEHVRGRVEMLTPGTQRGRGPQGLTQIRVRRRRIGETAQGDGDEHERRLVGQSVGDHAVQRVGLVPRGQHIGLDLRAAQRQDLVPPLVLAHDRFPGRGIAGVVDERRRDGRGEAAEVGLHLLDVHHISDERDPRVGERARRALGAERGARERGRGGGGEHQRRGRHQERRHDGRRQGDAGRPAFEMPADRIHGGILSCSDRHGSIADPRGRREPGPRSSAAGGLSSRDRPGPGGKRGSAGRRAARPHTPRRRRAARPRARRATPRRAGRPPRRRGRRRTARRRGAPQ